ncbi:MAG: hypothetical protein K6F99_02930 [Lachnospiraceae bacterium]|nr:hypothetical protein [Lachnospiraceae bacterium]
MADQKIDNERAVLSSKDKLERESFLKDNEKHILNLAIKVTGKHLTMSDDEYSIALLATNEAIDRYDLSKGNFWSLAAVLIKNRIIDEFRAHGNTGEISVRPEVFEGELDEDDPDFSMQSAVRKNTAVFVDTTLQEEILCLDDELSSYGISFFDLAQTSPKAEKTRKSCAEVIKAFFLPPPLVEFLKKKKYFPAKEIKKRVNVSGKIMEKHRNYLMSAVLILSGEYPALSEYLKDLTSSK